MSSSISSFRSELKVVLVVLGVLAACEVATRTLAMRMSLDDMHLASIPALSASLVDLPPPRILFLGNSLTREGVRLDSFQEELVSRGTIKPHCAAVCPDDTVSCNWYYLYKCEFFEKNCNPEIVLISFVGDWLSDQVDIRAEKVAHSITWRQFAEVFRHDVRGFEPRASFLLASCSHAVAMQKRIKERVLDKVVPHYRTETRRLNNTQRFQAEAGTAAAEQPQHYTYERLGRMISMFAETQTQVVFVLMPHPRHRSLDPELKGALAKTDAWLIDLRHLLPQVEGHFPDGHHMDGYGADIYSRALADALARRLHGHTGKQLLARARRDHG